MGLAEKRILAGLRDDVVPKYQAELREITGSDVRYDVDWDGFAENATAMGNLEAKALQPLSAIFREITADKIGKEAVASGVKKIHLSQGKDANITAFTLTDGVLNMPWDWEGWPGSFFPDSVREKIEAML